MHTTDQYTDHLAPQAATWTRGVSLEPAEPRVRALLVRGYRELLAVAIEIKNDAERAYCLLRLAELGVTEP